MFDFLSWFCVGGKFWGWCGGDGGWGGGDGGWCGGDGGWGNGGERIGGWENVGDGWKKLVFVVLCKEGEEGMMW